MAKSNLVTETVQVPVTTYREETKTVGVQLNLSVAEAQALRLLCGSIGGDPARSIRKYTDGIYSALKTVVADTKFHPFAGSGADARSFTTEGDPFKE